MQIRSARIPTSAFISELREDFAGRVIGPGDPSYDAARTIFHGGFDRRPAAIVRAAGADDVARAISLARRTGLELAVRSGGHSGAGHSVSDGGIVLDLRDTRALAIDLANRTAWAEAGLTAGEYTAAAATSRLATGFGDSPSVGLGGLTLGGGIGFLVRKHGLTIDSLLGAEVVTADGRVLHVDARRHPDLFWAIRGGGGNFGVVTRFRFRLHELDAIFGGMLLLPATPEVIAGFVAEADAAPDELSAIVNVMRAPPLPFLPAELHGRPLVMATLAYAGDASAGERAVAPFRALAKPYADQLRAMPYPALFEPQPEGFHPTVAIRTMFVDEFDEGAAAATLEGLERATAPMAVAQLRVLGGAVDRVAADATAYAHRGRRLMVNVVAAYERSEEADVHDAWVEGLAAELRDGKAGAYVNFLGDEDEARVREAYPGATWDRLAAVKARYDPTNLFRLNHNVRPATDPAA